MQAKLPLIYFIIFSCTLSAMDEEDNAFTNINLGCKICISDEAKEKLINVGCGQHDYCESCLVQYLNNQLEEGATSFKCPAPGCQSVLKPERRLFNQAQLQKNIKTLGNELDDQINQSCFVWKGLFKGFLGYVFCCFNCCGCVSFSDIEVCPYCKEVFQFSKGCNSIFHYECKHVFLKNSQLNIPCCNKACGCYFPNPIAGCGSFTYAADGDKITCNTCPSCWCIDF